MRAQYVEGDARPGRGLPWITITTPARSGRFYAEHATLRLASFTTIRTFWTKRRPISGDTVQAGVAKNDCGAWAGGAVIE